MSNVNQFAQSLQSPLYISTNNLRNEIELLKTILKQQQKNSRISVATADGYEMIHINDIIYLESLDGYVTITLQDNRKLLSCKRLKQFTEELNSNQFLRIHRSFILNIDFIRKYLRQGHIMLTNGESFPVGRTYRKKVLQILGG